jgi:hypothetical protein
VPSLLAVPRIGNWFSTWNAVLPEDGTLELKHVEDAALIFVYVEIVSAKYLKIVFPNEQQISFLEFAGLRAVTLRRVEPVSRRFERIYGLHVQTLVVHPGLFFVDRYSSKTTPILSFAVPSKVYQAMSRHILQDRNPYHIFTETRKVA